MAANINLTIEELNAALASLTEDLGQCCTSKGQSIDSPPSDGDISTGDDQQFPTQEDYFNAKCSAANGIYDTLKGKIDWLKTNNVDLLAGAFGGITTGIGLGLLLSGPVGWAIELSAVTITGIAAFLISNSISFEDLQDAFADVHDELVLSLYNASDTVTAETNFIAALDASSVSTTSVDQALVGILLTGDLLNQLFNPRPDIAIYSSPSAVDCGGAVLASWTFPVDEESWTFRDDSTANASATGSYNAAEKALQTDHVVTAGGSGRITRGVNVSPVLTQAVNIGDSIQWDYSAPSDSIIVFRNLTIIFSDLTEETVNKGAHNTAGTLLLTVASNKTITSIECETGRSNGSGSSGWTFETLTYEVRVVGS